MDWLACFSEDNIPSIDDILSFVGEAKPLMIDFFAHIEDTYGVKQRLEFSKCSAQPGWNIKYSKSGKSICTIYPMLDHFIVLVVIGPKDENDVELVINTMTPEVQMIYSKSKPMKIGRWLMIGVRDRNVLCDIEDLIAIRQMHK